MNNANIGNATSVLGNQVNMVMSNATLPQMKKYSGYSGIPDNSLIIVNPETNNIDENWNDICITDKGDGVKSLLPFTSVKNGVTVPLTESGEVDLDESIGLKINKLIDKSSLDETGNRQLTFSLPFETIDTNYFSVKLNNDKAVLTTAGNNLDKLQQKYKDTLDDLLATITNEKDKYDAVATKYSTLIDEIQDLADADDIIDTLKKQQDWLDENKDVLDNISNYNDKIANLQNIVGKNGEKLNDKFNEFQDALDTLADQHLGEIQDKIDSLSEIPDVLQNKLDNVRDEYDSYRAKLAGLVDNTKAELHNVAKTLCDDITNKVNNDLVPFAENLVDSCLANNETFSDAIQPAILSLLGTETCYCGVGDESTKTPAEQFADGLKTIVQNAISDSNEKIQQAIIDVIADATNERQQNGYEAPDISAGVIRSIRDGLNNQNDNTNSSDPVTRAAAEVKNAVTQIAKDQAAVQVATLEEQLNKANTPHLFDKRYFKIDKLSNIDHELESGNANKDALVISLADEVVTALASASGGTFTPGSHGAVEFS